MNRTLEQKRAIFAMKFIEKWKKQEQKNKDKIVTLIQKLPIQILQNGLGQTLAFLLADNEGKTAEKQNPSGHLYDELTTWLCGHGDPEHPCRIYKSDSLIEELMKGNRHQYIRAQQETLSMLIWVKKFAVSNLK